MAGLREETLDAALEQIIHYRAFIRSRAARISTGDYELQRKRRSAILRGGLRACDQAEALLREATDLNEWRRELSLLFEELVVLADFAEVQHAHVEKQLRGPHS